MTTDNKQYGIKFFFSQTTSNECQVVLSELDLMKCEFKVCECQLKCWKS